MRFGITFKNNRVEDIQNIEENEVEKFSWVDITAEDEPTASTSTTAMHDEMPSTSGIQNLHQTTESSSRKAFAFEDSSSSSVESISEICSVIIRADVHKAKGGIEQNSENFGTKVEETETDPKRFFV